MSSARAAKASPIPVALQMPVSGERFAEQLYRYETQFALDGLPIAVNFRELAGRLPFDRLTHLIHPYPAKVLPHIPYYLLRSNYFATTDATIVDPFCGSGTVLLEALANGQHAAGADSNPLARLIARVKTRKLNLRHLEQAMRKLLGNLRRGPRSPASYPDVVNIDYWFSPSVKRQLAEIRDRISCEDDSSIREFLEVSFSVCVRGVSFADPRLSVPVRLRAEKYGPNDQLRQRAQKALRRLKDMDVFACFEAIVLRNLERLRATSAFLPSIALCVAKDARSLTFADRSVDVILSSPPYVGAQKYIRASSLSLGWLGLASRPELRPLEDLNIGREHYRLADYRCDTAVPMIAHDVFQRIAARNPLRAHIAATYLVEMAEAVHEMMRVLKVGGHAILVLGNNTVAGEPFLTVDYVADIVERSGATRVLTLVDGIRGRGLLTSRHDTAGLITHESVLVFRKGA